MFKRKKEKKEKVSDKMVISLQWSHHEAPRFIVDEAHAEVRGRINSGIVHLGGLYRGRNKVRGTNAGAEGS